jgi:predicted enzyme related to lactoylglutathione lyase
MNDQTNSLNWFEIPVVDMARAKHFYQVIFSIHMHEDSMMGMQMATFPITPGNGKVGGALVKSEFNKPSMEGILIYLNANPDLDNVLAKVDAEGGKVLVPKTLINEQIGYMAFFMDTEGNRIGLHSQA